MEPVLALVMMGVAYIVYARLHGLTRAAIAAQALRLIAAVAGGAAAVAVGQVAASVFPNGPYVAVAIPLGVALMGGLVVWLRAVRPLLKDAATGVVLASVLLLLLYLGAG